MEDQNKNNYFSIEKKKETLAIILLGFFVFEVTFCYLLFMLNVEIFKNTLLISYIVYVIILFVTFTLKKVDKKHITSILLTFTLLSAFIYLSGIFFFSQTYDTSWDGQGYHSSGVISFAQGWNPIYDKELPINLSDAEIFVQGYPKALWLIQSTFYVSIGTINAAKVTNLIAMLIALIYTYCLLRNFKISKPYSILLAIICVAPAHVLMQLFSFMQDGFIYQMLVCAIAALGLFIMRSSPISLLGFIFSLLLLAGTKYSALPMVLILSGVFAIIVFKKIMHKVIHYDSKKGLLIGNKSYLNNKWKLIYAISFIITLIFFSIPYISNTIKYHDPVYPANDPVINKSYEANNIPTNIQDKDKLSLLFYGIFSKSQVDSGGSSDSPQNIAVLKLPFTFSFDETTNAIDMFNNRVGSVGPLFSGIFLLSLIIVIFQYKNIKHENKKYLYIVYSCIIVIILSNLFNPVPNLIRYNGQILLIPIIVAVSILTLSRTKNKLLVTLNVFLIFSLYINAVLFSVPLFQGRAEGITNINKQLSEMNRSNKKYYVKANNFYSHYIRLSENDINYEIVDKLPCKEPIPLVKSIDTTKICVSNI